ncbi:MAG: FAD-dependent thymidylate synthase [bacterium]
MDRMSDDEIELAEFAPPFERDSFGWREAEMLSPFFTNLDRSVYVPVVFSPEIIGALCSRTSRAEGDLRRVFLDEYLKPFLESEEKYGHDLQAFVEFLHEHPVESIFSNPRARNFYNKWLAQFGDDSIAQMAGTHLVFTGISQIAIKHFEDQRIGLAPIEKSTRYVDYSSKMGGQWRYYTDPRLMGYGLENEYREAMDGLFETYEELKEKLKVWLGKRWPKENVSVLEKKAFDAVRGLLPAATLSQLALFGNGQAFEYMIARSARHRLGEIRWAAEEAYRELYKIVPSFLRRLKDTGSRGAAEQYQEYMARRNQRVAPLAGKHLADLQPEMAGAGSCPRVTLVESDSEGETKIITAMLYSASANRASWGDTLVKVRGMSELSKKEIINQYLSGRGERWQKVGRAFESAYVRFEVIMNIGGWRDLHRHRMLTQQRQQFCIQHGYDVPADIEEAGLAGAFRLAVERAEGVYEKIASHDHELAQYAVTLAHRVRFMQWQNLRACFWEMELRTIPEGHSDYRFIEQEKFRLIEKVYPLIAWHMRVNMGKYDFARRGQEEKIQAKLKELSGVAT